MEREFFYNPVQERPAEIMPISSGIKRKKEAQEALDSELISLLEGQIEGIEDELPFVLTTASEDEPELDLKENDKKRQADLERALSGFIN